VTEYRINLASVRSFDDFIAAFNAGLIDSLGGHWNGNLDAFNDYLYWPEPHPYRLVLDGWTACSAALAQMPAPSGRSMLWEIESIFKDNPQASLIFR
jgi:hypothetical protein